MFILFHKNHSDSKYFSLLQPRIAKRCSIPVPMQVVVVIIGTGLSFGLGFNENYKVDVVGEIPQGWYSTLIWWLNCWIK